MLLVGVSLTGFDVGGVRRRFLYSMYSSPASRAMPRATPMPMPTLAPVDSSVLWGLVLIEAVGVAEWVVEDAGRDVEWLDMVDVEATRVNLNDVAPVWLISSQCVLKKRASGRTWT
jgi:hypothetical protein